MSFNAAHAFALSLATTLMTVIVIFRAGDGTLSVTPASDHLLLCSAPRRGGGGGATVRALLTETPP